MNSIYFTVLAFLNKTKNEYYIYKVSTFLWQKCWQRYPNYSFFVKLTFRTTSVSINGVVYVISDACKYCLLSAAYHPPNSNVYPKNVDVIFTLRSRSHLNLFFFHYEYISSFIRQSNMSVKERIVHKNYVHVLYRVSLCK